MEMDLAQAFGEGDLLIRCDVLIPEEDHAIVQPSVMDFLEDLVAQIGQIDIADLSAQSAGDRFYGNMLIVHMLSPNKPAFSQRKAAWKA
jgi:hypothetical protein